MIDKRWWLANGKLTRRWNNACCPIQDDLTIIYSVDLYWHMTGNVSKWRRPRKGFRWVIAQVDFILLSLFHLYDSWQQDDIWCVSACEDTNLLVIAGRPVRQCCLSISWTLFICMKRITHASFSFLSLFNLKHATSDKQKTRKCSSRWKKHMQISLFFRRYRKHVKSDIDSDSSSYHVKENTARSKESAPCAWQKTRIPPCIKIASIRVDWQYKDWRIYFDTGKKNIGPPTCQ